MSPLGPVSGAARRVQARKGTPRARDNVGRHYLVSGIASQAGNLSIMCRSTNLWAINRCTEQSNVLPNKHDIPKIWGIVRITSPAVQNVYHVLCIKKYVRSPS